MWRWRKTAEEMASAFAATRAPQTDEEFIRECGLADDAEAAALALAVRRSVASYGMVDSQLIRATDRYTEELSALSGWDSPDLLSWWCDLEQELGRRVPAEEVFRDINFRGCSVREMVRALCDGQRLGRRP
jgi:acyl carrier protein